MDIKVQRLAPLLIGIHLVAAPLYSRMPLTVLFLVAVFTLYAGLVITNRVATPGKFLLGTMMVTVLAAIVFSFGTILGQMPGTSMVILLSILKLFEMKTKRDVATVVFLGYFITATSFFHTQSPLTAIYVFVVVIYLTSVLIMFSDRSNSLNIKQRLQVSLRMVMLSVPLMLVLFILFPRVPGPLWGMPDDAYSSSTGIDDEMSPGSINRLISSGAVAFRVKFANVVPARSDLYWRGMVLSDYDGKTWRRDDAPLSARPRSSHAETESIDYTVTLQPHNEHWLFALEQLVGQSRLLGVDREFQLFARTIVTDVISYQASSNLSAKNTGLFEHERIKNLAVPEGVNAKSVELALQLKRQAADDTRLFVTSVLDYFRQQPFYYTLSPPLLGDEAVDDFLFSTQRGFCEHYASAFVYLMRAANVPARVVVGYQGGEMNPVDDYMIVRQSDAHAWAEVWLDDHWMRVDPTHAVSPQRIERGIQNAGLERALLPPVFFIENQYLIRARFVLDSFYNSWNQWVVGFNQKKQKELFRKLGFDDIDTHSLVIAMVLMMVLVCGVLAWWLFRKNANEHVDKVRAYYDVFCDKFAKAGMQRHPHEGPREFIKRIRNHYPLSLDQAALITHNYLDLRYGRNANDSTIRNFIQQVKQFKVNSRPI